MPSSRTCVNLCRSDILLRRWPNTTMPLDSRRLPVPEQSFTPWTFTKKDPKNGICLVADNGKRCDGRTVDQVRPLFLKTGVVSQAKGSSYVELDKTKLICAVYGPREVTRREDFSMKGQLNCEIKYTTFSCPIRRQHQQDSEEKDLSVILLQALEPAVILEKFPKARMDVFVTVLQDDGGVLAGAMTAASLALADAGVEMYDLVVGASMRCSESTQILDPCKSEEYQPKDSKTSADCGSLIVGLMPSLHQVAALVQKGHMTIESVSQGLEQCIVTCQRIYPVLSHTLSSAVKKKSSNTQKT